MMTARHIQLCDLCVVQLLLRHRSSWMFKPLDSIITAGMSHQSFWRPLAGPTGVCFLPG
jgi:hypothetical protein